MKAELLEAIGCNGYTSLLRFLLSSGWDIRSLQPLFIAGLENSRVDFIDAFTYYPDNADGELSIGFGNGPRLHIPKSMVAFLVGQSGEVEFYLKFTRCISACPRDYARGLVVGGQIQLLEEQEAFHLNGQFPLDTLAIVTCSAYAGRLDVLRAIVQRPELRRIVRDSLAHPLMIDMCCKCNRTNVGEFFSEATRLLDLKWKLEDAKAAIEHCNFDALRFFTATFGSSVYDHFSANQVEQTWKKAMLSPSIDAFDFAFFFLDHVRARVTPLFSIMFFWLAEFHTDKLSRYLDFLESRNIALESESSVAWVSYARSTGTLFPFLKWTVDHGIPILSSLPRRWFHQCFRHLFKVEACDPVRDIIALVAAGLENETFTDRVQFSYLYKFCASFVAKPDRRVFREHLNQLNIPK